MIFSYMRLFRLIALIIPVYLTGCKTIDPLVKNLFLTTERVEIHHPKDAEDGNILSEIVESKITEEYEAPSANQTDADSVRMIDLKEVSITADKVRIKRINDEKGWLNLFFEIKAPAVLLDSTWKLTIVPEIILNDTTRNLPPLVLKGTAFKAKQEKQYEAFQTLLDSIVPQDKYTTLFLDKKKITEDIALRRWLLYKSYKREINKRYAYAQWKKEQEKKIAFDKQKKWRDKEVLLQNFNREESEIIFETLLSGRDTAGIANAFAIKKELALKKIKDPAELQEKDIPKKYRPYYLNDISTMNMNNQTLSYSDSVDIALKRFKWDDIAVNEYNKENSELIKKSMITLPYADSSIMSVTVNGNDDFKYMYHYRIPLTEGLRKFDVSLNSIIVAMDETSFKVAPSDTLTFVIASIAELYDRSLIESGNDSTLYKEGINALESRYYTQAATLLKSFNDYNYALALACDGNSEKAELILSQLPQSANVLYLRSILNTRLKNYQAASEFLISAIKIRPQLINRTSSDPEITHLYDVARNLRDIITDLAQNQTN